MQALQVVTDKDLMKSVFALSVPNLALYWFKARVTRMIQNGQHRTQEIHLAIYIHSSRAGPNEIAFYLERGLFYFF